VTRARLLSSKLREEILDIRGHLCTRLTYWCQGCEDDHRIYVAAPPEALVPVWTWNGDAERPVFGPSVLYQTTKHLPPVTPENLAQWRQQPWPQQRVEWTCHTFIGCNGAQPGEVIFLGDCTHALRGAHVLPDLPEKCR
jgi:hypothetical protein